VEIYFDESGDFNPEGAGALNLAFILGVMIPEEAGPNLKSDFDFLVSQLHADEFVDKEPKGRLLTPEHRRLLLEILKAHRSVILIPITLNIGYTAPSSYKGAPARIASLIEENLHAVPSTIPIHEKAELAKRFRRLSPPALVRLGAYALAIFKAVEAILYRYHCETFHAAYDPILVSLDRFAPSRGREELVFRASVLGWIDHWSRSRPMRIPPGLAETHPLLVLYGDKASGQWRLDLKKMLEGKISFTDSKASWQIQLADFLVSTWSKAILDYEGKNGLRVLFNDLYRKSALPDETALGLVGLTDMTETVEGPHQLRDFARIAAGQSKILPCA